MSAKALRLMRGVLLAGVVAVVVVELVVALGVLLQLLKANPEATFAEFAFDNYDRLMGPFEDLFDEVQIGDDGGILDNSGLFALGVYAVFFIPLGMALGWVRRSRDLLDVRRQQDEDDARTARIFGEPDREPESAPGPRDRGRRLWERMRGSSPGDTGDDEGPPVV